MIMNKIILYRSNYHQKSINQKYYDKITNMGYLLKTNIFYYLTKSSFSGSSIIDDNNTFIGYHIGSTFSFILDELDSKVCWVGNIGYCRNIEFI